FISCTPGAHPDYAKNLETAQTTLRLQGTENDLDTQISFVHEDMQWQAAFHGGGILNKEQYGAYLKGWHDLMEDVTYTADNWLPGVSPDTGLADGSVRTYGKWSGIHTDTGKSWELVTYHTFDFKEGLIIGGGDYFDAGGLMASLTQEEVVESEDDTSME
ncbi:nuclear transport factor 2 family protein, partial [Flavobacteriaceae bacterium]|nr:nuclear transport factor 2 family protein [Flavobacteriaceae bacterium]